MDENLGRLNHYDNQYRDYINSIAYAKIAIRSIALVVADASNARSVFKQHSDMILNQKKECGIAFNGMLNAFANLSITESTNAYVFCNGEFKRDEEVIDHLNGTKLRRRSD